MEGLDLIHFSFYVFKSKQEILPLKHNASGNENILFTESHGMMTTFSGS